MMLVESISKGGLRLSLGRWDMLYDADLASGFGGSAANIEGLADGSAQLAVADWIIAVSGDGSAAHGTTDPGVAAP